MDALNFNISIPVEKSSDYDVNKLTEQATEFLNSLIMKVKTSKKKHYKHEALLGMIKPEEHEGQYLDGYLDDKYGRYKE